MVTHFTGYTPHVWLMSQFSGDSWKCSQLIAQNKHVKHGTVLNMLLYCARVSRTKLTELLSWYLNTRALTHTGTHTWTSQRASQSEANYFPCSRGTDAWLSAQSWLCIYCPSEQSSRMPVSYTHLDVYKRQLRIHRCLARSLAQPRIVGVNNLIINKYIFKKELCYHTRQTTTRPCKNQRYTVPTQSTTMTKTFELLKN